MENLFISGDTLTSWDIDDILSNDKSVKDNFERVQLYDFYERERVRDLYTTQYLNLEYDKVI